MQREVRKTVSVVFSDVAGSTTLAEQLDPESLRRAITRYFEVARQVHERHGGVIEKFIGDAVMAVFGVPKAHEDDALRAVRAAAELRQALSALNRELEQELEVTLAVRTGVNTGLVLAGDGRDRQAFVGGDTMNVAARLERAAAAGELLIGSSTYRLVTDAIQAEPMPPFRVRGKSEPVHAYRLLQVTSPPGAPTRRPAPPLVGRTRELAALQHALDRTVTRRTCELVTVLGDPGSASHGCSRSSPSRRGRERWCCTAAALPMVRPPPPRSSANCWRNRPRSRPARSPTALATRRRCPRTHEASSVACACCSRR